MDRHSEIPKGKKAMMLGVEKTYKGLSCGVQEHSVLDIVCGDRVLKDHLFMLSSQSKERYENRRPPQDVHHHLKTPPTLSQ